AEQLLSLYQEAEATFGVPWYILAAVNLVETGMGRIRGLSVAGAQGPMQFMPGTWDAYGMGGNVNDHRDAILGAANYLRANGGADGTSAGLDHALYRYNNSERYVRGVRAFAEVLRTEPVTLRGFHAWEVVYLSTAGDIVLEPGYHAADRIPVADFLAAHPEAAAG
ncbi:MAG TPA: lytic transglycosylase domain-containing protein, partial [Acidimicrobiales bacterium]|nr:lytic transglycosylase domain-containing protein [Acidimicrobiales bacterium]